jgi:hypothetical protein
VGIEKALLELADKILAFDEASLAQLQEKYLKMVSDFKPTKEWEQAIVVYFMINSIRVKNKIFNQKVKGPTPPDSGKGSKNFLKVIK